MITLELYCSCCGVKYLTKEEVIKLIQKGSIAGPTCYERGNEAKLIRSDNDSEVPLSYLSIWDETEHKPKVFDGWTGQVYYE